MNANFIPNPKNAATNMAYILVANSLSGGKGLDKFFVTFLDKAQNFVEIKGVEIEDSDFVSEDNSTLLKHLLTLNKSKYVHVIIPWHRVFSIKSLIFKHKEA